jgi:hypothetical protein
MSSPTHCKLGTDAIPSTLYSRSISHVGFWDVVTVAILLAVVAIILLLCLFIPTTFVILCLVLVVALLTPATGQANGQVTI